MKNILEWKIISDNLKILSCEAKKIDIEDGINIVNKFIYHREYSLAIDQIAFIFLESQMKMSSDNFSIFMNLVYKMEIKDFAHFEYTNEFIKFQNL